jgi:hypothetical protein
MLGSVVANDVGIIIGGGNDINVSVILAIDVDL